MGLQLHPYLGPKGDKEKKQHLTGKICDATISCQLKKGQIVQQYLAWKCINCQLSLPLLRILVKERIHGIQSQYLYQHE